MKKIFCILMMSMVILTGCASRNNANSIRDDNNVVESKENNTNDEELFNELQEYALNIWGEYAQVPVRNYFINEDRSASPLTDEQKEEMINHINNTQTKLKELIDKCKGKNKTKEVLQELYDNLEKEKEIPFLDLTEGFKITKVSIYIGIPLEGQLKIGTFVYNLNEAMKVDFPKYKEKTFEDGEELRERALKYYNEAKSNMK